MLIVILSIIAFLIYAGCNGLIVCDIMENYENLIEYFRNIIIDEELSFFGKIFLIAISLLFPIAFLLCGLAEIVISFEEKRYPKLKKKIKKFLSKKNS